MREIEWKERNFVNIPDTSILNDIHRDIQQVLAREGTSPSPNMSGFMLYGLMPECSYIATSSATTNISVLLPYLFQLLKWCHSNPGESLPLAPRHFVGRNELSVRVILLTQAGTPIVLIGAAGMGKTSLGLALFDNNHIKEKFRINCRFICCD